MKLIISLIIAFSIINCTQAQIKIEQKIKDKINQRADEIVDKAIDEGLDKAEEGAKKKTNTKTETEEEGGNKTKNKTEPDNNSPSVKNALSKDFGIDASKMETDGKGASEPASPNTSPVGKATNRRVE